MHQPMSKSAASSIYHLIVVLWLVLALYIGGKWDASGSFIGFRLDNLSRPESINQPLSHGYSRITLPGWEVSRFKRFPLHRNLHTGSTRIHRCRGIHHNDNQWPIYRSWAQDSGTSTCTREERQAEKQHTSHFQLSQMQHTCQRRNSSETTEEREAQIPRVRAHQVSSFSSDRL